MASRSRIGRFLAATRTDRKQSRRWLRGGIGTSVRRSLDGSNSLRILTDNPEDKEEWDKFNREKDDRSVQCEAAVVEASVAHTSTKKWGSTYRASIEIQAIIQ